MKNRYINSDDEMKPGDIFTDGDSGHEGYRRKNKAKVLYVDKFNLVWFPLNDHTEHTFHQIDKFRSNTWYLSGNPFKLDISDLNQEELDRYNNTDSYVGLS